MNKFYLGGLMCLIATHVSAQKDAQPNVNGSFEDIRNGDFTQLTGIATSGVSINYNTEKATINGSFTIAAFNKDSAHPMWWQLQPSVGTTTTLFELGSNAPQPEFSLSSSLTFISHNVYFYDGTFDTNYDAIRGTGDLNAIHSAAGFNYSESLRKKLQNTPPALAYKQDRLYTAKRIEWINVVPEVGGAKYNYYDKTKPFDDQFSKPYYNQIGIGLSFNHYWYVNNKDVHWSGFPTTRFFFYKLGLRLGSNNNSDFLKKMTFNDVSNSVANGASTTTRQVVKSTTAYSGIYERYYALTPSFEILYSFVDSFAIDLFGNYNLVTSADAVTKSNGSIAAGLYFYTNNVDSKINIGLYYQRAYEQNNPVKEVIGLKTKVPIKW